MLHLVICSSLGKKIAVPSISGQSKRQNTSRSLPIAIIMSHPSRIRRSQRSSLHALTLALAVPHLSLLKPPLPTLKPSRPHEVSIPVDPPAPSSRPTSLPQAYPALKLIAEKTR